LLNTILGSLSGGVAAATGSYESIATFSGSGVSTITFTSIPSTYVALQIRSIAIGTDTTIYLQFNSDTGANYTQHRLIGNGSTVAAAGFTGETNITNICRAQSTYPGVAITDIHDYASTSKYKTVRNFRGEDANGSGNVYLNSGLWLSTSAITSIKLTTTANMSAGTQFALYGIKGA
jgi:hypothetical protein